jgi:hypothetical protein
MFTICFTICLFISPDLDGHRAPKMFTMMNFMYTYTKTIKEADTHKLERASEESRRRNSQRV